MSEKTVSGELMSSAAAKVQAPKAPTTNAEYMELLSKVEDIPTLPVVPMRVNELINDPNSSAAEVADVLKQDQILTAKILRLANSSYYAIPGGVKDVQRALGYLGFNTIAQLILGLSVFSMFEKIDGEDFSMLDFWKHALGTAVCCEILAKQIKYKRPEEAFTCGLLHDIGKLVLNQIDPKRFKNLCQLAKAETKSFVEAEKTQELPGHAFVGEAVATKWNLPMSIRLAIRYHHTDVTPMATLLDSEKPVIHIVRLANQIVVKKQIGKSGDYSPGLITEDMLKPLGLNLADIAVIEERLEKQMELAGAFLGAYR